MGIVKRIGIALLVWAAIVVVFELSIGFFQPEAGTNLVITTADEAGDRNDRVLARLESDGKMYVAANHWPRAWYKQALANPHVHIAFDGEEGDYAAVPVAPDSQEHEQVYSDNDPGLAFRVLTGFPPRYFLRLDPRPATARDLR